MEAWKSVLYLVSVSLATCNAVIIHGRDIKIPDGCKGKRFCDIKPGGYDELQEIFDRLLPDFLVNIKPDNDVIPDFEQRMRDIEKEHHNCIEEIQTKPAYFDLDYDIIIQTEKFQQKIDEVVCKEQKVPADNQWQCFQDMRLEISDHNSVCEPFDTTRTVYVLHKNNTEIISKEVPVRFACVCMVYPNIKDTI